MFHTVTEFLSPASGKARHTSPPRDESKEGPPSSTVDGNESAESPSPRAHDDESALHSQQHQQHHAPSNSEPVTPVTTPVLVDRRPSLPVFGEKRRSFSFLGIGSRDSNDTEVDPSDFGGSPPTSPRSTVKLEVEKLLLEVETKFFFWREKEPREHDELYQKFSSRAASSFQDSVKSGNLTKLGKIHKTWRERYFVLDGSLMFYYDSPKSERPKGVIDVAGCEVLRDRTRGKNHCFQISHKNRPDARTFVFFGKNEDDMRSWLRELVRAADAAPTASPAETKRGSKSRSRQASVKQQQSVDDTNNQNEEEEGNSAHTSNASPQLQQQPQPEHKETEKEKETEHRRNSVQHQQQSNSPQEASPEMCKNQGRSITDSPKQASPSTQHAAPISDELLEEYHRIVEQNQLNLLAQVEPHGTETKLWKVAKDVDGILVSTREISGSSYLMSRVEGRIRCPSDLIMSKIRTLEYDPLLMSLETVTRINDDLDISHLCMRSPVNVLTNRDFAILRFKHRTAGGWVLGGSSVNTKSIPQKSGFVRASILNSGWVVTPIGVSKTESFCTYVLSMDPRGWVPTWVANMFRTTDMLNSFAHLKQLCESEHRQQQQHQHSRSNTLVDEDQLDDDDVDAKEGRRGGVEGEADGSVGVGVVVATATATAVTVSETTEVSGGETTTTTTTTATATTVTATATLPST